MSCLRMIERYIVTKDPEKRRFLTERKTSSHGVQKIKHWINWLKRKIKYIMTAKVTRADGKANYNFFFKFAFHTFSIPDCLNVRPPSCLFSFEIKICYAFFKRHDILHVSPLWGVYTADIGQIVRKQAKVTVPPKSPQSPGRDRHKAVTINNSNNTMNHVNDHGERDKLQDVEMDIDQKKGVFMHFYMIKISWIALTWNEVCKSSKPRQCRFCNNQFLFTLHISVSPQCYDLYRVL